MQNLEYVADDRHGLSRLPSDAFALAGEECPVCLAPEFERAIAFALNRRILGSYIAVRHEPLN